MTKHVGVHERVRRSGRGVLKPQVDTVAHFPLNPFSGPSQSRITANWQSRKFEVLLVADASVQALPLCAAVTWRRRRRRGRGMQ